jgi:hypothetical protein
MEDVSTSEYKEGIEDYQKVTERTNTSIRPGHSQNIVIN